MKAVLLVSLSLLSVNASAASRYFYSYPGTDSGEWSYTVSPCRPLPPAKYRRVQKKCTIETNHETCTSNETAKAENTSTFEKRKFPKILAIFGSKADCQKDQKKFLSADF